MDYSENNNFKAKRKKILIIDDESIVGISSKRILEPENYEVTFHQDPERILSRVRNSLKILVGR